MTSTQINEERDSWDNIRSFVSGTFFNWQMTLPTRTTTREHTMRRRRLVAHLSVCIGPIEFVISWLVPIRDRQFDSNLCFSKHKHIWTARRAVLTTPQRCRPYRYNYIRYQQMKVNAPNHQTNMIVARQIDETTKCQKDKINRSL